MKKIEAIIRSSRFDAVKEALAQIGVNFLTFSEVKGYGHQRGEEVYYRGAVYDVGYIARLEIQLVVPTDSLEKAIKAIQGAAYTGEVGDGRIFVSTIEHVINIRTGSTDENAL